MPFLCVSEIFHQPRARTDDNDEEKALGGLSRREPVETDPAALLRQRFRIPGRCPLQAVLLTHLREARQPWRNQDRSFLCFEVNFNVDDDSGQPLLTLETYTDETDQAEQEQQLSGLTAVGFLSRSLFALETRMSTSACLSVWSDDRRLGDLVCYCCLTGRCLLLQNAVGSLLLLCAESERMGVIKVLDRSESSTLSCILKLKRQDDLYFIYLTALA